MKKQVTHQSIQRASSFGGVLNTTLCGRMDNSLADGWNVGDEVTCKHCLNASKQSWGQKMIELSKQFNF